MVRKLFTALIISISFVYGEAVVEEVQQKVVMGDTLSKKDARVYALDMAKFVVLNKKSTYIEYSFTKEKSNSGKNITKEVLSSLGGAYATSELVDGTESVTDGTYNARVRVSIDMDSFNRKIKALEENTAIKEELESLKSSADVNNKELLDLNKRIESLKGNIAKDKELTLKQREEKIIELQAEQKKVLDKITKAGNSFDDMLKLSTQVNAIVTQKAIDAKLKEEKERESHAKEKELSEKKATDRQAWVREETINNFLKVNNITFDVNKSDYSLLLEIDSHIKYPLSSMSREYAIDKFYIKSLNNYIGELNNRHGDYVLASISSKLCKEEYMPINTSHAECWSAFNLHFTRTKEAMLFFENLNEEESCSIPFRKRERTTIESILREGFLKLFQK